MRRCISVLLAFALASGETFSLAAPTVFRTSAVSAPSVPVGTLGLDASAPATTPGDLSLPVMSPASAGTDISFQPPALPAVVPSAASPLPAAQAALPVSAAVLASEEVPAAARETSPAREASDAAPAPGGTEKAAALDELHQVESEGGPSKTDGPAVRSAFYDGSAKVAGVPEGSIDESAVLVQYLEQVRAGTAGALPEAAKQSRYVLIPGLNWDLLGSNYFRPNLQRLAELGLSASMVRTDPLAKAQANVDAIRAALEASDVPAIVFTHSKGGTDLDEALKRFPGLRAKIRHIVAIQAPHGGTQIADFFSSDAAKLWAYSFVMAAGRLLNPWRMFSTSFSQWHEGVRQLSERHRARNPSALHAVQDGVGLFSVATRFERKGFVGWLKKRLFHALHRKDNDGIVPTAGSVIPGSRYAVLEGVGHLAPVSVPNWQTKLAGTAAPYKEFAAHLTEALVRWIHSDGTVPILDSAPQAPAPASPEPEQPPRRPQFWTGVVLGITLALLVPVFWKALPPAMIFYSAPLAFGATAALWLAVHGIRFLYEGALWSLGGYSSSRPGWLERLPVPLPQFARIIYLRRGLLLGSAAALAAPFLYSAAPVVMMVYTGAILLAALGIVWAASEGWRLARGLIRFIQGKESPWEESPEPAQRKKLELFGLGLLPGLALALAAPVLYPALSILIPVYGILAGFTLLWLFWTASESGQLAYRLFQLVARRRWGGRKSLLSYVAGLALGLGFGAAPALWVGPLVEKEWGLVETVARKLAAEGTLMNSLPEEGRWGLNFLAQERAVRSISPEMGREVEKILAENEEGRLVLDGLRDRSGIVRMPSFFVAKQETSSAFMTPLGDGVFIHPFHIESHGWTIEEFLADPEKQRQVAREGKETWLHELVHAVQSRRFQWKGFLPVFFPGQLEHFPRQVAAVPHIQLEYEAHIRERLGVHAWLKANPHDPDLDIGGYESFLEDLEGFLKGISDSITYKDFASVDSEFFRDFKDRILARWPAMGVEGYVLLARRELPQNPDGARAYMEKARRRAAHYGLPDPGRVEDLPEHARLAALPEDLAQAALDGLPQVARAFPAEHSTLRYNLAGLIRPALAMPDYGRSTLSGLVPLDQNAPQALIHDTPSMSAEVWVVRDAAKVRSRLAGVPPIPEDGFFLQVTLEARGRGSAIFRAIARPERGRYVLEALP